jgi:hypothetical protein
MYLCLFHALLFVLIDVNFVLIRVISVLVVVTPFRVSFCIFL